MKATSRFAPSASSPSRVDDPSASTWSFFTRSPRPTIGFWWMSVPWFDRMNFVSGYSSLPSFVSTTIFSASTSTTWPAVSETITSPGVDRGPVLEPGADERRLRDHQRHCLPLHVRAHERAVRVVVLEERDQCGRDRDDLRRGDVHEVDVLRRGHHGLAARGAAEHLVVRELPGLLVDLLGGLRDRVLRLLDRVEVDDLVGHLAVRDLAVRRLDEAELADGRHRGERQMRPMFGPSGVSIGHMRP